MRACSAVIVMVLATAAEATPDRDGPLVLPTGQVAARLALELGGAVSLAPDLWVGIADRWSLGVTHANDSVDQLAAGGSICLREDALACRNPYRGSALDVRFGWRPAFALHARLLLRDVDPWKPAITLGLEARWSRGAFSIETDPYLRIGLAHRGDGNRNAVVLPIWVVARPAQRVVLAVQTGLDSDLAVLRDGYRVPVGLAVRVGVSRAVDLGAALGWASALGPRHDLGRREVALSIGWRSDRR